MTPNVDRSRGYRIKADILREIEKAAMVRKASELIRQGATLADPVAFKVGVTTLWGTVADLQDGLRRLFEKRPVQVDYRLAGD